MAAMSSTTSRVTLGEGGTPLVSLPRLAERIGIRAVYGKLEGCNPTGSYKDRIAAASMTLAQRAGKAGWVATSSGNGGSAMAAYGAHAGLPGLLFVVPSIPREKLVPAQACGAHIVKVTGLGDEATSHTEHGLFQAVRSAAAEFDLFLGITAHAYNPEGMRGADAISAEIIECIKPQERVHVYVPTGGGGLAVAIARGIEAARARFVPVLVQPAGCAPIVRFLAGELETPRIEASTTAVSGLQLPAPPDGDAAADAAGRLDGWGTLVSDEATYRAQKDLAEVGGLFVEPASATALAGCYADRAEGRIGTTDVAVLVLTGTGLKDLATTERKLAPPLAIEPAQVTETVAQWVNTVDQRG